MLSTIQPTKNRAAHRAENRLIKSALKVLEERMAYDRPVMSSPSTVKSFLALRMAGLEIEVFMAIWLDAQNRVIQTEEISRGTLTQTGVYPREIVKRALAHNAGGVIFAHNHPTGVATPSQVDILMTKTLRSALNMIDVRLLDHFVVAGPSAVSLAERGHL